MCKVDCGGKSVAFGQSRQGRAIGREVFDEGEYVFAHVLAGEQELVSKVPKSGL